jgi:hypothetical protein
MIVVELLTDDADRGRVYSRQGTSLQFRARKSDKVHLSTFVVDDPPSLSTRQALSSVAALATAKIVARKTKS